MPVSLSRSLWVKWCSVASSAVESELATRVQLAPMGLPTSLPKGKLVQVSSTWPRALACTRLVPSGSDSS
ncbi:MAG: hypothetical protein ACLP7O_14900 [Terracidiphilus sp.]